MEQKSQTTSIVRIGDKDVKGDISIFHALIKLKGVRFSFAKAICKVLNLPLTKKIGTMSKEEIKKVEDVVENPKKYNIPNWILNRRFDPETGESRHLTGPKLDLQKEFDIRNLKKIKCYRGVRHMLKLPVRGQRTKGAFRTKGKTVGVVRKKQMPAKARR
ncbi:MAG: 30S ribosomal protein S13 [Candidatus Woesearchaeota archaeon]|nr:MAG: 30S ribosomal protein S13 [Candidatus Woesearchaeota archaeon]